MNINILKTNSEILKELQQKFKNSRLAANISQKKIAEKAGTSIDVVRRFEQKGQISLSNLIALARVLNRTQDFEYLFKEDINIKSLKELNFKNKKHRLRARD